MKLYFGYQFKSHCEAEEDKLRMIVIVHFLCISPDYQVSLQIYTKQQKTNILFYKKAKCTEIAT